MFFTIIYCVGAVIRTLRSVSNGLGPYLFHRKMEKTRPMREKLDGKVFIPHRGLRFAFKVSMIKVLSLFVIFTLTWRANNYGSRQGRGKNRTNESSTLNKFHIVETVFAFCRLS